MSFLGSLAKGFVRSAINQVGRDGGKVISNRVYRDSHSTPIRIIGLKRNIQTEPYIAGEINSRKDLLEASFQPELLESSAISYIFIGIGSIILPIIGLVYWIYIAFRNFFKKYTKFFRYSDQPVYVRDRRYRSGQRHEGYSKVKEYSVVAASPTSDERLTYLFKGALALIFAIAIGYFQFNLFNSSDEPKIEVGSQLVAFGLVISENGINLRNSSSSIGEILMSIPRNSSVEIINSDGPEETIGSKSANWMQVKYEDKVGWVWGGFIEIDAVNQE